MSNETRILSAEEKQALRNVLRLDGQVLIKMFGEGKNRTISLYQHGTRLEARIAYPESEIDVMRRTARRTGIAGCR